MNTAIEKRRIDFYMNGVCGHGSRTSDTLPPPPAACIDTKPSRMAFSVCTFCRAFCVSDERSPTSRAYSAAARSTTGSAHSSSRSLTSGGSYF